MKKQYTMFLVLLLGLLGFSTHAEGVVTFLLESGSAKVWTMKGWTAQEVVATLEVGTATDLPVLDGSMGYAIVPGDGLTLTVTDKTGASQYVQPGSVSGFSTDFVKVPAYEANSFNIVTKEDLRKDVYDIKFNISGGGSLNITYYDYSTRPSKEVTAATVSDGEIAHLPANQTYYVTPSDGYELVNVSDENGNAITILTFYDPAKFQISTSEVPSSYFDVTMKDASSDLPQFNLTDGSSAALWYMPTTDNKTKVQDFVAGNQQIPLTGDAWDYYIVANDADATLTVTHNGTPLEILTDNSFSGNQYAWLGDEATGEFVITTTKAAPSELKTNVYVASGSKAEVMVYTGITTVPYKSLEEGDNEVVFDDPEKHYYLHGAEGHALTSVTKADGTQMTLLNDGLLGKFIEFNLSDLSSKYTAVTSEPEPQGDPTVILTAGSKAYYVDNNNVRHELEEGKNFLNMGHSWLGERWYFYPETGYKFTSFTDGNNSEMTIGEDGSVSINMNQNLRKSPYTITTAPDEGDNTFTLIVDDASKINMYRSNYTPVDIVSGSQEITIDESSQYIIYSAVGGYIYSVTLDGVPVADSYGQYFIPVEGLAGKTLNVQYNYPDEQWTYTLESTGDPIVWKRAATRVYNDDYKPVYTDITNFDGTSVTAKAGSDVVLWAEEPESYDKKKTTVSANGKGNEYLGWSYWDTDEMREEPNVFFTVSDPNGKFTINAVKAAPVLPINFHLNDGSSAAIYRFNNGFEKYQDLKTGDNTITIPDDGNYYYIVGAKGAELTVKDDKDNVLTTQTRDNWFDGCPFVQVTNVETTRFDITTSGGVVVDPEYHNITVTVNTPDAVKFYSYYSPYSPERSEAIDITLVEGTQTIKVAKTVSQMSIVPADNESVINGIRYKAAGSADWTDARAMVYPMVTYYDVWAEDGLEIDIDASHVTYDSHALIYTDNGNNNTVTMKSEGGREIMLGSGSNDVDFNADDSKFTVTNSRKTDLKIYVNGSMIEGNTFQLKDNDIVKIYELSDKPVTVTFAITATAAEVEGVKVTDVMVDGVTPVNYPAEPIEVLPGSGVSFKVAAPEGTTILVMNGEYEVAPAEGVYTVWPTADTEVAISYTAKEAFALMLKGSKIGEVAMTEADGLWTATLPELTGSFTVVSNDGTVKLGSNGSKVELGKEYEASADSSVGMSLECGSAAEVTVTVDLEKKTVLVNGTTGIITLTRDQLDADAIYYDLTGRRIEAANIANGLYIRVAGSTVTKIAVK